MPLQSCSVFGAISDPTRRAILDVMRQGEIDAPPAAVFKVLTTPEFISQWFPAPAPVVEPRVGGKYGFGFSYEMDGKTVEPPPCTILEYEQDKKLSITWPDWRGDSSVPDQRVTWTLEDLGGRTRLVLVHDGFTRPVDVSDYPFPPSRMRSSSFFFSSEVTSDRAMSVLCH